MNLFLLLTVIIMIIIVIFVILTIIRIINFNHNSIETFQSGGANIHRFMKCIFFTNKQYNNDKIHIPSQSLYIENEIRVNSRSDINNHINNIIDFVYQRLNWGNNTGIPVKIPAPIFALIGRKLEYDSNIFEGETFNSPYKNQFRYGTQTLTPDSEGKLAIMTYLNTFFNSGLGEMPRDQEKLKESLASSFKFKGNTKIIIYFPYLTNRYKYVSNFTDIINSSRFFYTLINNNKLLNFKKTTVITFEDLKKKFKNLDDRIINILLEILTREDRKAFTFYEDLLNLCVDGGCVSDYGEDLTRLTTSFTEDMNQNNEEAIKKSPYLPSKCLAQTKGYFNNVKNIENNVDLPEFLKKNAMKELGESLNKFIEISDKIARGDKDIGNSEESKKIADYTSPVDLIISIINKYISKGYATNLNDGERDGIKLNHYSKDFSRDIIKELSLLNKFYPGVPEMVMSMYIIDETMRPERFIYHPWGKTLISARNVLQLGDSIPVGKSLFSFNNRFVMTFTSNGIIYTYDTYSGRVLYFINRTPVNNSQLISIGTTNIVIEYIANDKNRKSTTLKLPNDIKSFIGNCDECTNEPYNLIISDNDGSILIYANSFVDATSMEFKNYINIERKNAEIINLNINDTSFSEKIGNPPNTTIAYGSVNAVGIEEDYVFCADKDKECKK